MRSKWVRIISMALVGTMLLTGCGAAGGDKKEDSKDEKREFPVRVCLCQKPF